MRAVLGAFAGHVPRALQARYPAANVSSSPAWGGFSQRFSANSLLEASDPLFATIGAAFMQLQFEEYGSDHVYLGDTFNEMQPQSTDAEYLASWGSAVYDALRRADPAAVWLVQ